MSLYGIFNSVRIALRKTSGKHGIASAYHQKFYGTLPPYELNVSTVDEQTAKRPKRTPIPKITLISGSEVSVTTLEEAQKLSKRRDLKLVKIVDLDTKSNRPIYKLMSGSEYHVEDLKQRELKKQNHEKVMIKGEKLLLLNASIATHDLETKVSKIEKWLAKQFEIRVVINGDSEKSEGIYKFLKEKLQAAKFLQKRNTESNLKFQLQPPRRDKHNGNNDL